MTLVGFGMGTTANTAAITISAAGRFGDIVNDDTTDVTISDLTVNPEGDGGTMDFNFVVTSTNAVQPHPAPGGVAFIQPFTFAHGTTEAADLAGEVVPEV